MIFVIELMEIYLKRLRKGQINMMGIKVTFTKLASGIATLLCMSSPFVNIAPSKAQETKEQEQVPAQIVSIREIVYTLVNVLQSENVEAREAAARALGGLGTEAKLAVPALMVALKDEEKQVRYSAAVALGNLDTETAAAFPVLLEALQYKSPWLRSDAADAIGNIAVNLQMKASDLSSSELEKAVDNLEKALIVLEKPEMEFSDRAIASVSNPLEILKYRHRS